MSIDPDHQEQIEGAAREQADPKPLPGPGTKLASSPPPVLDTSYAVRDVAGLMNQSLDGLVDELRNRIRASLEQKSQHCREREVRALWTLRVKVAQLAKGRRDADA